MQTNIQDFGIKIGGAKKDLAQKALETIALITGDTLMAQPFSKSFPCPDFVKMYRDNRITVEQALKLQYLYNAIETKPRAAYKLRSWSERTMTLINTIREGLADEETLKDNVRFTNNKYFDFTQEMRVANWPQEDYNPTPYKITRFWDGELGVTKNSRIVKLGTMQECVSWIRQNPGIKKSPSSFRCSIYRVGSTQTYIITPHKKPRIVLKEFSESDKAIQYRNNNLEQLEQIYKELRTIPEERRAWNRPRIGTDHRFGLDILPELFSATFDFRGVEFGNWVTQLERAACLNEAYDALLDFSFILGITPADLNLNKGLALAFGSRGSGNASAHYERDRKVINLTKTRGAGSLAHEWFHALDNHIATLYGQPLLLVTEKPARITDSRLYLAVKQLTAAIKESGFYKRSEKIDELKSKKYWATIPELAARAFEKYIISKLEAQDFSNDYLANIVSYNEYLRPEIYPYPTDEEIIKLIPCYDEFLLAAFSLKLTLSQSA